MSDAAEKLSAAVSRHCTTLFAAQDSERWGDMPPYCAYLPWFSVLLQGVEKIDGPIKPISISP